MLRSIVLGRGEVLTDELKMLARTLHARWANQNDSKQQKKQLTIRQLDQHIYLCIHMHVYIYISIYIYICSCPPPSPPT